MIPDERRFDLEDEPQGLRVLSLPETIYDLALVDYPVVAIDRARGCKAASRTGGDGIAELSCLSSGLHDLVLQAPPGSDPPTVYTNVQLTTGQVQSAVISLSRGYVYERPCPRLSLVAE